MRLIGLRLFLLAPLLLLSACSGSEGEGGTADATSSVADGGTDGDASSGHPDATAVVLGESVVGPAGGTVSAGAVSLRIPAGALTEMQTIVVSSVSTETATTAPEDESVETIAAYSFEPAGLNFAMPVEIAIAVDRATFPAGPYEDEDLMILTHEDGEGLEEMIGANTATATEILADTQSFSIFRVKAVRGRERCNLRVTTSQQGPAEVTVTRAPGNRSPKYEVVCSSRECTCRTNDPVRALRDDGRVRRYRHRMVNSVRTANAVARAVYLGSSGCNFACTVSATSCSTLAPLSAEQTPHVVRPFAERVFFEGGEIQSGKYVAADTASFLRTPRTDTDERMVHATVTVATSPHASGLTNVQITRREDVSSPFSNDSYSFSYDLSLRARNTDSGLLRPVGRQCPTTVRTNFQIQYTAGDGQLALGWPHKDPQAGTSLRLENLEAVCDVTLPRSTVTPMSLASAETPPVPTGGTLVPGVYFLSKHTVHGGMAPETAPPRTVRVSTAAAGLFRIERYQQRSDNLDGIAGESVWTVAVSGTQLVPEATERQCGRLRGRTFGYSSADGNLVLSYLDRAGNTHVESYGPPPAAPMVSCNTLDADLTPMAATQTVTSAISLASYNGFPGMQSWSDFAGKYRLVEHLIPQAGAPVRSALINIIPAPASGACMGTVARIDYREETANGVVAQIRCVSFLSDTDPANYSIYSAVGGADCTSTQGGGYMNATESPRRIQFGTTSSRETYELIPN